MTKREYRIDMESERASVRFWISSRSRFVAMIVGFIKARKQLRETTTEPIKAFTIKN